MTAAERAASMIASPDEDPNVSVQCSSPPCFMHELDPSYLGYLGRQEVAALLGELLEAEWPGTLLETAWLRAMLRRHLAALPPPPVHSAAHALARADKAMRSDPEHLAARLRDVLPRLHDHGLRDDLRQALGMIERSMQRRGQGVAPAGQCWEEVRRWRKAQREALIARRLAVTREERREWNTLITARLEPILGATARMIGVYWPFKGEYDPRPLMRSLHAQGMRLALPVVVERARPLVFREWRPGIRMAPGIWDIPVPAEGEPVQPDALVAPLVGFDGLGYRLGYGGGYYDRTLAAMDGPLLAIGVGFELAQLDTIHPQPHDVPMSAIVTERRVLRLTGSVVDAGGEPRE